MSSLSKGAMWHLSCHLKPVKGQGSGKKVKLLWHSGLPIIKFEEISNINQIKQQGKFAIVSVLHYLQCFYKTTSTSCGVQVLQIKRPTYVICHFPL